MSDTQRNLSIKITTTADTAGFSEAGKSLGDLTEKTGAASKAFKESEVSGRELRELVRQLGPDVDGLGRLVTSGLANPILALGFAMVVGKGLFDEWNKTMDETAARNAKGSQSFKALQDAAAEAAKKAAEFNHEMAAGKTSTEQANDALSERVQLLREEAQEGREQAEDAGASSTQLAHHDQAEHEAELHTRGQELAYRQAAQPGLESTARTLRAAADREKARRDKTTVQGTEAEGQSDFLKKRMEEMQELELSIQNMSPTDIGNYGTLYDAVTKAGGFGKVPAAARAAENAYYQNQGRVSAAARLKGTPDLLGIKAAEAEKNAREGKTAIEDQAKSIAHDTGAFASADRRSLSRALDRSDIGGGFTGQDVKEGAQLVQLMAQHAQLTASQKQATEHLAPIINILKQNLTLTLQVAGSADDVARNQHGLLTKLQSLEQTVAQVKSQLAASALNSGHH